MAASSLKECRCGPTYREWNVSFRLNIAKPTNIYLDDFTYKLHKRNCDKRKFMILMNHEPVDQNQAFTLDVESSMQFLDKITQID